MGEILLNKNIYCFILFGLEVILLPIRKNVRSKMAGIDPEKRFVILQRDTTLRDVDNKKGFIATYIKLKINTKGI